jgi:hypothetical protein
MVCRKTRLNRLDAKVLRRALDALVDVEGDITDYSNLYAKLKKVK